MKTSLWHEQFWADCLLLLFCIYFCAHLFEAAQARVMSAPWARLGTLFVAFDVGWHILSLSIFVCI